MRVGPKDRRINLEVRSVAQNTRGEEIETWSTTGALWAQRVEGSKVTERFAADQTFATVTTIFRVGYWPAYGTISVETHRIMFDGRIYNILGAIEIGRKDGVELLCVARGEK